MVGSRGLWASLGVVLEPIARSAGTNGVVVQSAGRPNKGMKLTKPGELRSFAAYPRCSADLGNGRARGERTVSLALRAVLAWFILFAVMFANGAARVAVLQPRLGEDRARQVASLTGVVLVFLISWLFLRATPHATARQFLWIGVGWFGATLAFEFLFGHFVSGLSWSALLADYNILRGRLWLLIVISVCLGPWLCALVGGRGR
jgi:hypothetical protein